MIGGAFAFEIVEGEEKSCEQAEGDAERVDAPVGRVVRARDEECPDPSAVTGPRLLVCAIFPN